MNFDQYLQATIGMISYLRNVHNKIEGLQADQRHLTRNVQPPPPQMPINLAEDFARWAEEEAEVREVPPIPQVAPPRRETPNERPKERNNNFSKPK